MLRNYLLTAIRNFGRQKVFTLINISGLAIGIASALLIFLYISNELTYDTIHPEANTVFRLGHIHTEEDGSTERQPFVPGAWGEAMREQFPEVEQSTRAFWFGYPAAIKNEEADRILLSEKIRWVESTYPQVLYFEPLAGSEETALAAPNAMAINETTASKLFPDDVDPIGKIVKVSHPVMRGQELDAVISSVFKDYPDNVHLQPDYLINIEILRAVFGEFYEPVYRGWDDYGPDTYLKLRPGTDIAKLESSLTRIVAEHQSEAAHPDIPFFTPVTDLHFDSTTSWVNEGAGDINYIYIFASIGMLILFIASINYMNLATARSTKRAMEIGLRKTMGGRREQLVAQFFGESAITTAFSAILAILLVLLALPLFNQLAQKTFSWVNVFTPTILIALILLSGLVTLLSGIYPAIYLSGFRPVEVLKGRLNTGKGPARFRKALVVVQFSISVVLIICTAIMLGQMRYIRQSKLSKQGEQMLSIRFGGNAPYDKYQTFKSELLKDPELSEVTIANHLPRQEYFGNINTNFRFPNINANEYYWGLLNADHDFPQAFDVEIIAGRGFAPTDSDNTSNYLINESGAEALGLSHEELLGKSLLQPGNDTSYTGQIIGIFKDFPFRSMRENVEPMLISTRPNALDQIVYVELPRAGMAQKIASVERAWKAVFPDVGFDYWFISDEFSRMYLGEERIADLTRVFAILALIVACLGVYGLASFLADRKTKEIGVRKILGAQMHHIVGLLSRTFVVTILIASLIGIPVSYYLMNKWLNGFVYHVPMPFWIFAGAVGLLLVLTWVSIGFVTVRAASTNPIQFIRDE